MGVDIADFNNDALPDMMTLDMLPEDNKRQKHCSYRKTTNRLSSCSRRICTAIHAQHAATQQWQRNIQRNCDNSPAFPTTDWSWSPLFADFDNDGYKDLFITSGYLRDYTNKDFLRYWGDYKIKKAMDREPVLLMDLIKAMPVHQLANCIFQNNGDLTFTKKQQDWGLTQPSIIEWRRVCGSGQ